MKTTIVRYKTKPECAEENAALVAKVFEALAREKPAGLRYQALRAADGVSFTHVVSVEEGPDGHPLTRLDAFKAFTADIKARCVEPPQPAEVTQLGRTEPPGSGSGAQPA